MKQLFSAAMNGRAPSVPVAEIREDAPVIRRETAMLPFGGSIVTGERRISLTVRMKFTLPEPDMARRQEAIDSLIRWCRGEQLSISTRPGQVLRVQCTAFPRLTGRWPEIVEAAFTAYAVPCWQEMSARQLTLTGLEGSGQLFLPGTAENAPVRVEAENTGNAPCATLAVRCGSSLMMFSALGLMPRETLVISHDRMDRLGLTIRGPEGERSAFARRVLTSDDDLRIPCGQSNTMMFYASAPLRVRFEAHGRYL